ncbi:hypothetical protein TTRE_0000407901 [Trichuris trichiura]|uniref:Uncharacterized protein n=1 Tax=Trichuris trichiura TaxID=36087 RepID=A0A077Z6J7_TRITR|nr:hypothetical protein TTRE_0000407901 [Trichuris trichiura]
MRNLAVCALLAAWFALAGARNAHADENLVNGGGRHFLRSPAPFDDLQADSAMAPTVKLKLMPDQERNEFGAADAKNQKEMSYEEAKAIESNIMEKLKADNDERPIKFSPAQRKFLDTVQNTISRRNQEKEKEFADSRQMGSSISDSELRMQNEEHVADPRYVPYSGGYRMVKKVQPEAVAHKWKRIEGGKPSKFRVSNFESDHVELLPDGVQRRHWYSHSLYPTREQGAAIPALKVGDYMADASSYLMKKPEFNGWSMGGDSLPFLSSKRGRRKQRNIMNSGIRHSERKVSADQPASRDQTQPLWITLAKARKNWEVRFKPSNNGFQPYLTVREQRVPGGKPIVREGFLTNNTFRIVPSVQSSSPAVQADTQNSEPTNNTFSESVRVLNLTNIDAGNIPSLERVPMEFLNNVLNITSLMSNDEFKRKKFKCSISLETKLTICGYVLENKNR